MNDIGFYQSPGGREINEDTLFSLKLTLDVGDVYLLGVADGMGGMAAGEVASQQAVETVQNILIRELTKDANPSFEMVKDLVRKAIEQANTDILTKANGTKMGSTTTCAVIISNTCIVGHIGDCRAYVLSESNIVQATEDHAVGSALTKRLGKTKTVSPDVFTLKLDQGETLIICSDGLHGPLSDKDIAGEFNSAGPAKSGCIQAVQQAMRMGGPRCDNISVVAFRNGPPPGPQMQPQRRVIQHNGHKRVEPSIKRSAEAGTIPPPPSETPRSAKAIKKEKLRTLALAVLAVCVLVLAGVAINLMVQPSPPEIPKTEVIKFESVKLNSAEASDDKASEVVSSADKKAPQANTAQDEGASEEGGIISLILKVALTILLVGGFAYWLFFIKLSLRKNRYNG